MTPDKFKQVVSKIQKLNPSPQVYAKVHRLIAHPDSQLDQIVSLVRLDSALTADIVRLSNSAALGTWESTGNLNLAMGRLGLKEVDRFLALSISKSVLNQPLKLYDLTPYEYWSNSVSVAILMELLATRNLREQADAYTVGILHATGRLVMNQAAEDLDLDVHWDRSTTEQEWEKNIFGHDYGEAGALLLEAWGFPHSICEVIRLQIDPKPPEHPSALLRMLRFCLRLVPLTGNGFTNNDWSFRTPEPFLEDHQISIVEMHELTEIAAQMHREAEQTLGMKK